MMVKDAITAGKAVLDDIVQDGLLKAFKNAGKINDVFVLILYAGLKDLARNLNSRRLEGDYRGMAVFTQFAERYIATYGFLDCSLTSDEEFNCVFVEAVMSNFNVKTFKGGYYSKGNNKFLKKKTIRKNKKNTRKNKKNSRKNNKKKSRKV